jgi:CubicO group peptidase (beta-lactamase class C family)
MIEFIRTLWLSVTACALAQGCTTTTPNAAPDIPALTVALEAARIEDGAAGFAIALVDDGELIYAHGFGETELGTGDPVTPDHIFHWASVSKPLVATAIMQISERGQLDLDDALASILPDYRITEPRQREITIRQILLHTSGIPDVEIYNWDKPEYDDGALLRWALTESPRDLLFDPGTGRKYSNVGYEILGAVIERVSGLSFEDYMRTNIFDPLAMQNATFAYPETDKALRTVGHAGERSEKHKIEHYPYNRRHGPSSTFNASVVSFAPFAQALLAGGSFGEAHILKTETLNDMWAPRWTIDEARGESTSMGWVIEERPGRPRMIRHFGWDDGFRSALLIFPDANQAVLYVTNDEDANLRAYLLPAIDALKERASRPD